jgi:hypothetical protein
MDPELELGTASVDITPLEPLSLAGFAHRTGSFEKVDRRLYAKIWFFQQRTASQNIRRALLIQADLIWWGPERIPGLIDELRKKWGLREEAVIFHATHTHGGPQTTDRFVPSLGAVNPGYLDLMEGLVLEGVWNAYANLGPVYVERETGRCRIGIHRRRRVGATTEMGPNPDGPIDPDVEVIRFVENGGPVKGVLFHYACHPTTSGDNRVTSEYPGAAMDRIEKVVGAQASFLQGCCGDIRPALIRNDDFHRGDAKNIQALGLTLAEEVLRVLDGPMERLKPCLLSSKIKEVMLTFGKLPTEEFLLGCSTQGGVTSEWSRLLLADRHRIRQEIPLKLQLLRLADGLSILAMDAEIVVEYGLFIKKQSGGSVLPLPYSNGMIGYVPTADQLSEGGYEASESTKFFGLPAPFDPSLERRIREAVAALMDDSARGFL